MSQSVLVVSPHPDDEAIGCGGTIRKHVLAGDAVRVLFLSSGEKGGHGRGPDETVGLREAEARAAAVSLGYGDPEFWRAEDGAIEASERLIGRLAATLDTVRPDLVYTTHPAEMHPDHRAAADLVAKGVARAALRPIVLMFEVWTPLQKIALINDIGPVLAAKVEAIRCYRSQIEQIAFDEAAIALNRYRGELLCWPDGEYAEVFQRMEIP
jgi:LmbE family N-acetylglucosaminyl deacetylase